MGGNSSFYVVRYKDCNKLEWNSFAELSGEGWFWHTSLFLEAWPYGENISFCIKNKFGEIVLEQVLFFNGHVKESGHLFLKRFHGIPYLTKKIDKSNSFTSIGGFARKNDLTPKEDRKLSLFYIDYIKALAEQYQVGFFDYSILATLPIAFWPERCPLVNPMIFYGYKNSMSQSYIIDLSKEEDVLFKDYVQTTRNLINRCKKDPEIKIVEAMPTREDLDKYYALHVETYERTGVQPHPKKYFEHIFLEILKEKRCHILFLYRGERLVVANNVLMYKGSAMYWTGCSVTDKGGGESRLLMHEQILYAKRNGCKYFEVGECFPNIYDGKLKGLNDFKKSFGGIVHPIFSGKFIL